MSVDSEHLSALRSFRKTRDYFVGIDSDGCVFDTMEVKHKECFIPNIIGSFGLAAVSKYAREAAEFVNLYSKDRGINRFPALTRTLDLLAARPEVSRRGVALPKLDGLRAWIDRETKLGNPVLEAEVARSNDPDLALCLSWSKAVNQSVAAIVRDVPPFPMVREALSALEGRADVMVVSATPVEALTREWREHGIVGSAALIAGQEMGSKREHLATAAGPDRYERDHVLMIGDAPGDRRAAESNRVLFYPINPGREDESWSRLHDEALPKFFEGTYAGDYMRALIEEFEALLPETPPWGLS